MYGSVSAGVLWPKDGTACWIVRHVGGDGGLRRESDRDSIGSCQRVV